MGWNGLPCIEQNYRNRRALRQSTNSFAGCEGAGREILTSWLKMADENETAPQQEKETEIEVDHGHCSNCENEEHHSDDGWACMHFIVRL